MFTEKQLRDIIRHVSALGALPFYAFITLLFLVLGEILLFKWLISGIIVSYIIGPSIRLLYHKERPTKREYTNFLGKIDSSSFPSMHSYRISMLALFSTLYYNDIYIFALFSLVAVTVMISRHFLKHHFISDIIAGGLLGLLTAYFIIILF